MNIAAVLKSNLLADLAVETYWQSGVRRPERLTPTWPLDLGRLAEVTVHWPAQYEWHYSAQWFDPLIAGFKRYVRVEKTHIPQVPKIIITRFLYQGRIYPVVIDQSDYLDSIDEEWARKSLLYFKMHYAVGGYGSANIVPGGFVPHSGSVYRYLPYLRKICKDRTYKYDVYSRFSLEFAGGIRQRIHKIISAQDFQYGGGASLVRYSRFLREVAQSKICIDVPGNADVCCRLIDYLAVGTCIIGLKPRTVFHAPMVDREHIAFVKPDLSDLASLCNYYLEHSEEREQMAQNGRQFFDKYLHRDQIAAYYLSKFLEKVT